MTLELTTATLFLFSTFYGNAPTNIQMDAFKQRTLPAQVETSLVDQPQTLETYIREYFKETPILAEIAKCESRFRHIGRDGKVIRGEIAVEDVGVMQINEFYHEESAEKLDFDLHTLDGNLSYAKWLYAKEGTAPWYSSSKCWQKSDTIVTASVKPTTT